MSDKDKHILIAALLLLFALEGGVILGQRKVINDQAVRIERQHELIHEANIRARQYLGMYQASEEAASQCERLSGLEPNQ